MKKTNYYFRYYLTQADLSRFSRDYIETGNYLECVFPFPGVQFVSINDGLKRFSYTGALVTNKKSAPSVGSHKFRLQDKSKWIVVNNQYEPIISEEEYEKAQRIFRKMKKSEKSPKDFPLRSVVRCGYCGRVMSRRAKGRGFFCFYHSDSSNAGCRTAGFSTESDLEDIVFRVIRSNIELIEGTKELLKNNLYTFACLFAR